MRIVDIIIKKRDGYELSKEEIDFFIKGITEGSIKDYQASALLMAIYFEGMTSEETTNLTMAMVNSGELIDLSSIEGKTVDKHSTGGVGDKTTLIVGPLVAAAGAKVAKMSGRGLGHTGGTIDKLESYPDYKINIPREDFIKQVNDINIALIGQSGNITPADKILYALRDVTGTVESIPLIASSIMSKKIAAGTDVIVLDVKVGDGAFMKTVEDARRLAGEMVKIGNNLNRKTVALLTNMDEPLGYKIGNCLEVEEVIDSLKGKGPEDLVELSLQIGEYMLYFGGYAQTKEQAREMLEEVLESGKALEKFYQLIEAQGASREYKLDIAEDRIPVYTAKTGYVKRIKAEELGTAAMLLGAGRASKEDKIDYSVGIEICAKVGDYVSPDIPIAYMYSRGKDEDRAKELLLDAYEITDIKVKKPALVYEIIE
ncbi:pyrimidine-nucleoside phosphorylase [Peptoniphilaceae bacterium SGI.131]